MKSSGPLCFRQVPVGNAPIRGIGNVTALKFSIFEIKDRTPNAAEEFTGEPEPLLLV